MFITGISDEAGKPLDRQIQAHRDLDWNLMEIRNVSVNGGPVANLHDIPDDEFDIFERAVKDAGLDVYCFSSRIANWQKQITEPFEPTLEEARCTAARMRRLGTQYVRIMSYAILKDAEDQMAAERIRRVRDLVEFFRGEGLTPLHENCMNYGGMGWPYTYELLEEIPGLQLVFDTGNPIFADDRSKPLPWPKQSAWEFYQHVRDHIAYVHIKDGVWSESDKRMRYTYPGDGAGDVVRIVDDLIASGYDGGFSIEPHMSSVYHDPTVVRPEQEVYATYLEYGRRMTDIIAEAKRKASSAIAT